MHRHEGRYAVVTGAAGGVGRAVVGRLLEEGASVLALDRSGEGLAALPDHDLLTRACVDLTEPGGVDTLLAGVERIDTLVAAAGVGASNHAATTSDGQWQEMLDINLTGAFRVIRAALPALLRARGAVVTIASIAGLGGRPYTAGYSAAKGGLVALTRALAVEHASRGVRFCCVAPGSVDTTMAQEWPAVEEADEVLLGRARSLLPEARATPEDIAAAVAFLGSDEARFITGSVLVIDGGALA